MKNKILPLTRGLLISMCFRCDNSLIYCKHTYEYQIEMIDKMYEYYLNFSNGYLPEKEIGRESSLLEEVSGTGFYSPNKEMEYAYHWPVGFVPDWFTFKL